VRSVPDTLANTLTGDLSYRPAGHVVMNRPGTTSAAVGDRRGGEGRSTVGVLDRFEKGIERAVNGAFAKAFRSEVQPVEIASALRRECDDRSSIVGRDRTIAPNSFVVELGPGDYERLGEWKEALGDELTAVVHDHARQQRYAFVGPVVVTFEQADDLDTGVFRVRSATSRPSADPQHRSAGPGPGRRAAPRGSPSGGGPFVGQAPPGGSPSAPGYPDGSHPPGGGESNLYPASPWPANDSATTQSAALDIDGQRHQLTKPVTVLGRALDADVVLDDAGVSRRHAEVHLIGGRARVIDLGSTNGTFVDGERVHAGDLTDGSSITVGRTRITFHAGQW
jgi:hypothetical protein